ncbi:MAG TPA: hypothetical protein VNK94_02065 [Gaiellaceae bacterium]|nr:hypothetical protein [Gaiellaceae bacterium]
MSRRTGLPLVVTLKVLVVGLTALGALGGLERFEEKGFGWRLLWYPAMILALPVIWRFFGRGRYPYLADALLTLPFFVDVMGNVLNLYDSIDWWDDANHFANWLFLSLGIGMLLLRTRFEPVALVGFVLAWGATSAIVWELGEYLTFIRTNEDEFATAYTDTLGDLTLDLCGALLAASLTFAAARRLELRARF